MACLTTANTASNPMPIIHLIGSSEATAKVQMLEAVFGFPANH